MPVHGGCTRDYSKIKRQAIEEVKAKFPDLQKDSSGWYRAVENRFKRLCR